MRYLVLCSNSKHLSYKKAHNFKLLDQKLITFPDKEFLVIFEEKIYANSEFLIIQSIFSHSDLIELLFTIDAIKRSSASKIKLIVPYFGYARQNKIQNSTSSVAFDLILNLFNHLGIKDIFSIEIHSCDPRVINISLAQEYTSHIKKKFDLSDVLVVSPDLGRFDCSLAVARNLDLESEYFCFQKERLDDGMISLSECLLNSNKEIVNNVLVKKNCIVIDDIISSGSTLKKVTDKLRCMGFENIFVYCAHFLRFVVEQQNLQNITMIYTTNLYNQSFISKFNNVEILEFSIDLDRLIY